MPRHWRPRHSRLRVPVSGAAFVLAGVASFGLATIPPSMASVAPEPVAARDVASPSAMPEPTGAVAGATTLDGWSGGRDRRTLRAGPVAPSELSGYRWPLAHARITLPFGPWADGTRVVDGEPFHDGLDMSTFCGDRIVAAHDGVVLAAGRHYDSQMGWIGDLGPYVRRLKSNGLWDSLPIVVVIDDGNGYRSIYAHFEKLAVQRGQAVRAGELLGHEGMTGRATGCHLHYGLFSPAEHATFGIDPTVAEHMKLPAFEIARIDPLLVLPPPSSQGAPSNAAPNPRALAGDDQSVSLLRALR